MMNMDNKSDMRQSFENAVQLFSLFEGVDNKALGEDEVRR